MRTIRISIDSAMTAPREFLLGLFVGRRATVTDSRRLWILQFHENNESILCPDREQLKALPALLRRMLNAQVKTGEARHPHMPALIPRKMSCVNRAY